MTVIVENESKTKAKPGVPLKKLKRLVLPLGDKGGTSKSFIIRKIAEMHMEDQKAGLQLVDGDATTGSLYKFHESLVETFSVHGTIDERDRLVNDVLRRGSDLVIADMPATTLTRLREIAADYDFVDAVTDAGYRLTVVAPITPYDDPVLDLQDAIEMFDPALYAAAGDSGKEIAPSLKSRVDYVAVVNLGFAEDRSDFELWDAADGFTRNLLKTVGGIEIEIPKLRPRIPAKMQKYRLAFKSAEASEHFSLTDRGRLQRWNQEVEKTLRSVGDRLGF